MVTSNYNTLYPELSLSELFSRFTGQEPDKSFGPERMFLCPEHNDTQPSLAINDEKDVGFCHSVACGWKFNRYQLVKWAGALPDSFREVVYTKPDQDSVNKSPKAERVANALCNSPLLWEKGNAIYNCHTFRRRWKCLDCGEEFIEKRTNSCGSALCPDCRSKQIKRFIDAHRQELNFYKGIKGITVKFPGKVLDKVHASPVTALQLVIKESEALLLRFTRKIPVCRSHIRVKQLKLQGGIAWVTLHILFDGTDEDAELVKLYFNERLPWSTANLSRPLKDVDDALRWLKTKANEPLEFFKQFGISYPTDRDIELYAYATHGKRLIQGAGRFYSVSGGKGYDQESQKIKRAFAGEKPVCPKCGSTRVVKAGIQLVRERSPTEPRVEALKAPALSIKV